jgi:hypothetical protein
MPKFGRWLAVQGCGVNGKKMGHWRREVYSYSATGIGVGASKDEEGWRCWLPKRGESRFLE